MNISSFVKTFLYLIIKLFAIRKNYLIFESGDCFYDNSYALYKYITNNPKYKKYKVKYLVTSQEQSLRIKKYLRNQKEAILMFEKRSLIKLYYYSLKSKFIFYSYNNSYWKLFSLKKYNKLIYLGHGEFPIKNVYNYYHQLFSVGRRNELIVAPTEFVRDILQRKYDSYKEIKTIISGSPRNDLLINPNVSKEMFLNYLGFCETNVSIVLCLCTFRNRNNDGDYFNGEFPLQLNKKQLLELDGFLMENNKLLVIKIHHLQNIQKETYKSLSRIVFIDNSFFQNHNIFIESIFVFCDCLITDYSSAFFAFLQVDKPLGFLTADIQQYENERGFTLEKTKSFLPGEKINNFHELLLFLNSLYEQEKKYKNERKRIKGLFLGSCDNNCERLMDNLQSNKF